MPADPPHSSIIEKTITILDAVHRSKAPLRFPDIVNVTGLNKSSIHRILRILVAQGLLRHDAEQKSYEMGGRVLDWAQRFLSDGSMRGVSEPVMEALAAQFGQNVLMAIRDEIHVVYVNRVEAVPAETVVAHIGARAPLQCTAIGKCLLAFASDAMREQILARIEWVSHTENTITDRARLLADLDATRQRGFALDDREHQPNVHCIAAPIRNLTGRTVAAMSITANCFRVPRERLLSWSPLLRQAACDISVQLGAELEDTRRLLRLG